MNFSARLLLTNAVGLGLLASVWVAVHALDLGHARELTANGEHAAALQEVQVYLESKPESVEAGLLKGVVLTRMGKVEDAISAFRALATAHPDIAEPQNNLAVLYAKTGQFDAARQALEHAVAIEPNYGIAHENLGDVYAKLASQAYKRAASLGSRGRASQKARVVNDMLASKPGAMAASAGTSTSESAAPYAPSPRADAQSAPASHSACYAVTGLSGADDRTALERWAANRGAIVTERAAPSDAGKASAEFSNYMVFLPPRQNQAEAEALLAELTAQGVRDVAQMRRGDLSNGIALGVYSSKDRATRRRNEIAALGYADVKVKIFAAPTYADAPLLRTLFIFASSEVPVAEFARAFPSAKLTPIACAQAAG